MRRCRAWRAPAPSAVALSDAASGTADWASASARAARRLASASAVAASRLGLAPGEAILALRPGFGVGAERSRLCRGEAAASSGGGAAGSRSARLGRIRPWRRGGVASGAGGALASASNSAACAGRALRFRRRVGERRRRRPGLGARSRRLALPPNLDDECGGRSFHVSLRCSGLARPSEFQGRIPIDSAQRGVHAEGQSGEKQHAPNRSGLGPKRGRSDFVATRSSPAPREH